ncbi:MAG TPA: glycosyltransferase [Candidatus Methylomirabilis sp.]|nr:glycosyltransferase [Candidatus Methylomirabilis sp.]
MNKVAWLLTFDRSHESPRFANHLRFAEMAAVLRRRGFTLELITPAGGLRSRVRTSADGDVHRLHPSAPSLKRPPPGWEFLWLMVLGWPWLLRLALRERPAVIFTATSRYAPVIRWMKRRGDVAPFVFADVMGLGSIELDTRGVRGFMGRRIRRHLEGMLQRDADLVTTVNERHATIITQLLSPRSVPIVVRDAAAPIESERLPEIDLSRWGIPDDTLRLGFLGQLFHGRLDDLLSALDKIPPSLGLWTMIAGDGPDRPAYERRVATSERLRDRVVFVGYIPGRTEALALVGTCDIAFADCWSPAGFPLKLFEYMALGRAIIVEGKEQMREVLREGEHCVFYRSVDELAAAIIALCEDEPRRRRLGQAARALFEASHTLDHRRAQLDALIAARVPLPARQSNGGQGDLLGG